MNTWKPPAPGEVTNPRYRPGQENTVDLQHDPLFRSPGLHPLLKTLQTTLGILDRLRGSKDPAAYHHEQLNTGPFEDARRRQNRPRPGTVVPDERTP
jgi:hypothetical protein